MKKNTLYIYMLVDPRNDKPFYVGRSIDPKRRYTDHIRDGKKYEQEGEWVDPDSKSAIIDNIMADGILPTLTIIDNCKVHDSWLNEGPGWKMFHRIMDSFEGFWAVWVEKQYGVWLAGKQKEMSHGDDVTNIIATWKHWLETGITPKIKRRDPAEMLKRYQEIMQDLDKMRRGEQI